SMNYVNGSLLNHVSITNGGLLQGTTVPVVRMQGSTYVYMSNVLFSNHRHAALDLAGGGNGTFVNLTVERCQYHAITNAGHETQHSGQLRFIGCTIQNNTYSGIYL